MNNDNYTENKEEMMDENKVENNEKAEALEEKAGEEITEAAPDPVTEAPSEPDLEPEVESEQGEVQGEIAPEKPIIPTEKGNRFFLAALFPLVFILVVGIMLLLPKLGTSEQSTTAPTHETEAYYEVKSDEVRGVFVSTAYNLDYPSAKGLTVDQLRKELDSILTTCHANGLNSVYFQVSPYSDALYNSKILPTSHVLSGTEGAELPGGFDPLKYLCDTAPAYNIAVHAWVNPVRVTAGSFDAGSLSDKNPAVLNPEYTFTYDGNVYYNLGVPEVRHLQARVCAELAGNYNIDGIIFDDYFYPQLAKDKTPYDDSAAYKQHGADYENIDDFRRGAVLSLITECYDAIKATRPECSFGVSPAGVWQNNDGKNGGSDTRGMESYSAVYCDTLAFVSAGKVDYIAPQLYWTFETQAAPYAHLCDWWAQAVNGTGVDLYIVHAAYNSAEWQDNEIFTRQVEYARTKKEYGGSLFFRYKHLSAITDVFNTIYEK